MHFSTSALSLLAALAAPAWTSPITPVESSALSKRATFTAHDWNCGCAGRKAALITLGATAFDLAVGVQETGSQLTGTGYAFGDTKSFDSACFSFMKYNWYSIRTACSGFQGKAPSDYASAQILNTDDAAAIKCMHEQRAYFAGDTWFVVQRDGAGALGASAMSGSAIGYRDAIVAAEPFMAAHMGDDMVQSSDIYAQ